ncbi:unnamed protein product [Closterium sp. NIES-64]|nr:unnamed protein product [Closterium sp. NIES-64]
MATPRVLRFDVEAAATDVTAGGVTTSSRSRGSSGRRGGQGASGGGGGGGGDVASGSGRSVGAGGAPRATAGDSPAADGGGDVQVRQPPTGLPAAGGGAVAWYLTQRQQQQQQQQPLPSQQPQLQQRQQQILGQGSGQPPSGLSHATPPPSVAPQVPSPSPQSFQPAADPAGAGFRGEDLGGASSRCAGVGAESIPVRGPGSRGAGAGAEPVTTGDSCLCGAGASELSLGVLQLGVHPLLDLESLGWALLLLVLELQRLEEQQQPPQLEEQRSQPQQQHQPPQLEEQRSQPQQQQQAPPPPPVSGLRTIGLPSPSPPSSPSPPVSGPPLPPLDPSPAVFPPSLPPLPPPLPHTWPLRRSPRARPSSPVPFSDLPTAMFCSSPPRLSPALLPSPPELALTASLSTPVTDYYRTYRPILSRVLASLVTDPRASLSSVSAITVVVTEFASTRRLDYTTNLVAAPPTSPLAVESESALGSDALEDRQFELEFLAAATPHLCAMLLAPEGDPDALDIPTPRTYAEAVSGPWAS